MSDPLNPPINYPGGIESIWSLEKGIKDGGHNNFQDWMNSLSGSDINKNPNAIDWEARYRDGKIDKATGQVIVQASDGTNGYSQPELQLAYEKWRRGQMASNLSMVNASLQENNRPILEIRDHVPSNQIGEAKIAATNNGLARIVKATDNLTITPGGTKALAALGEAPTISQLQGAQATLQAAAAKPLNDLQIRKLQSALQTDIASRQSSAATTALNRDTFNLNSTVATNNQKMEEWRIQQAAETEKFRIAEATRRAEFDANNSNADRALQLQLAEMSAGERRSDREYTRDRDARSERQLMIMSLMDGLKGLNGIFQ